MLFRRAKYTSVGKSVEAWTFELRTNIRMKSFKGGTITLCSELLLAIVVVVEVVLGELLVLLDALRLAGVDGGDGNEWLEDVEGEVEEGVTVGGGGLHSMTVAA